MLNCSVRRARVAPLAGPELPVAASGGTLGSEKLGASSRASPSRRSAAPERRLGRREMPAVEFDECCESRERV